MPVASLTGDLIDVVGIVIVLGMASFLVYRATRSRSQDNDPEFELKPEDEAPRESDVDKG